MPIKLGLAGLFFAIFLKKTFNVDDFSITVFGGFYALCAWAMGYQWNIMWLDTFALLPLVALGTVSLLRDKKFILYTISLFLSVFANYYIGFFTCIFVLLAFICYEVCRCKCWKDLGLDFLRIALFSVLAIGMTAILELPALAALQNTQSSVNEYPDGFSMNIVAYEACAPAREAWEAFKACDAGFVSKIGLWVKALWASFGPVMDGMRQVAGNMGGAICPTFKEGLPNLYCGIGSMVLAFLFLTSKEVKVRDRVCSVCLLVFFMLSFLIRQLDYIWHGLHFTNMIPYRFSFLFSFVILYMAYRAWLIRSSFKLWQLLLAGVLAITVISFNEKRSDALYLAFNLAFILLYLGVFVFVICERMLQKPDEGEDDAFQKAQLAHRRQRQAGLVLCAILCLELGLNVVNFGARFSYTTMTNYHFAKGDTVPIINYLDERSQYSDFFRTEVTHSETLNDGAVNGYYGISTFTSSANVRVTEFMRVLGLGAKNTYNRYCYEETSPVTNLFLDLKYMIERNGNDVENAYFDKQWGSKDVFLLKNNAYLPLGFLAEPTLETSIDDLDMVDNTSIINLNDFDKQNNLFTLATGIQEPVWSELTQDDVKITAKNVELEKVISPSYTKYHTSSGGRVYYTYTADSEGLLCLRINQSARNSIYVYKNGRQLYYETLSLPQILSVGDVQPGDKVEVEVICKSDTSGVISIWPAVLNEEVFRQGYDILNASTWDLTEFSNTYITGTIDCNRDGLMYTSIPYDGNWVAEVDGEEAKTVLVGDAMMALKLTEGKHTVTFRYENKAFKLGAAISAICLIIFLSLIFVPRYLHKHKGKYQK